MKDIGNGDPYGAHRVIEPEGALPQPAQRIDNNMDRLWDNEILVDVDILNIDAASFAQIRKQAVQQGSTQAPDLERKIGEIILQTVADRGKQHNPVTGSGGMFVGRVAEVGKALADRGLSPGDRIASSPKAIPNP